VLGAIFVPSRNNAVVDGELPGEANLFYHWDRPEGSLRLYRRTEAGKQIVACGRAERDGIVRDVDTKAPLARVIRNSLVFDATSLADATEELRARSDAKGGPREEEGNDEPKLCPDPTPDQPHGASNRAWLYQYQISKLNNPQRPLDPGLAVGLLNPKTDKLVVFDDCRERDGTMIEAKGLGYAWRLRAGAEIEKGLEEEFLDQAEKQVDAGGSRDIEWFFAEPEVMEKAKKIFERKPNLRKIKLIHVPAEYQ
jgi:hypothetical protein